MSVLDELRAIFDSRYSSSVIVHRIEKFEAAHPGLVDDTEPCSVCGKPTSWRNEAGVLTSDRGILCWDCFRNDGPLRPACAKEENHD